MSLIYNPVPPHVSRTEFNDHVLRHIANNGWTHDEREKAKMVFEGLLDGHGKPQLEGLDAGEINDALTSLHQHHGLHEDKIKDLAGTLNTYLKK